MISTLRERPERSAVPFRAQSKDAIPSQVLLGKRPFDCALHPSAIAQDAQGSAQGASFRDVLMISDSS